MHNHFPVVNVPSQNMSDFDYMHTHLCIGVSRGVSLKVHLEDSLTNYTKPVQARWISLLSYPHTRREPLNRLHLCLVAVKGKRQFHRLEWSVCTTQGTWGPYVANKLLGALRKGVCVRSICKQRS